MFSDLRYALRQLFKNPGFTAVAVLTLAIGSGASTAIFSIVNSVLLRPLSYVQPGRLVRIYTEFPTFPNGGLRRFAVSAVELLEIRRETKSWESLEAWVSSGVNLAVKGEPTRATAAFVTGGMLTTLGTAPAFGRLISLDDDVPGAPLVANISYSLLQRTFGGCPKFLGKDILPIDTKVPI